VKKRDRKSADGFTLHGLPPRKSHLQLLTFQRGEARVPINGSSDIVAARKMGTQFASRLGFSATEVALIAAIVSEVARIITHGADRGSLTFSVVENGARRGLEVVVRQGMPSRAEPAADELSLVGKLMDEFTIVSAEENGMTVRLKKWRQ
jgi:serine/threonine-protein kinase RsbT